MSTARIAFICLLVTALLGCALPFPVLLVTGQKLPVLNENAGCVFGYMSQSGLDFSAQWKEIHTTGEKLVFGSPDDGIVQAGDFGFNFPFFENTYRTASVSTNGFIVFDPTPNAYSINNAIPMGTPPNNFVAGFWDDLVVGQPYNSGAVYYQAAGTAAVFEWYQVTRLGSKDLLTFEIVLQENGDIYLNYAALNGVLNEATVGIEDQDGVDGLQMTYNSTFLSPDHSYRLVYPATGARVKVKPLYQGGFLTDGLLDLPLTITNTGTSPESFHFVSTITGSPDGQVNILDAQGAILTHSSTPVLNPKQALSARIRVTAVKTGPIGQKWSGTVTVISDTNSDRRFEVSFDAATPASFVMLYDDSSQGYAQYFSKDQQIPTAIFPNFQGKSYSIVKMSGNKYLLTWEETGTIKNVVISPVGGAAASATNLTNSTNDKTPQVAVAPNGTIGMVYVHWTINNLQFKTNVHLARLDANGNLLSITDLTQNENFYATPFYSQPNITATTNNNFVISYEALNQGVKDIGLVVVDKGGNVVQNSPQLINSNPGYARYFPTSTAMQGGKVLIAFLSDPAGQPRQVNYLVYDPGTHSVGTVQIASPTSGGGSQLETLANGSMLLAWVKSDEHGVNYSMITATGSLASISPLELAGLNGWKIGQISLTGTHDGRAAVTWKDEWGMYLYYALIDANGAAVTSPMAFLHASNPVKPILFNSSTGNGTAPFSPFNVFLPLTKR